MKSAEVKGSRRRLAVFCQAGELVRHLCSLSTAIFQQSATRYVNTEVLFTPKLGFHFKVKSSPMMVQSKKQKIIYELRNPNTLRTLITDTHQRHFSLLPVIAAYKYLPSKLCCASLGALAFPIGDVKHVCARPFHPPQHLPPRQASSLSEPIHQTGMILRSGGEVEAAVVASAPSHGLTLTSQTRSRQERLHCCCWSPR